MGMDTDEYMDVDKDMGIEDFVLNMTDMETMGLRSKRAPVSHLYYMIQMFYMK